MSLTFPPPPDPFSFVLSLISPSHRGPHAERPWTRHFSPGVQSSIPGEKWHADTIPRVEASGATTQPKMAAVAGRVQRGCPGHGFWGKTGTALRPREKPWPFPVSGSLIAAPPSERARPQGRAFACPLWSINKTFLCFRTKFGLVLLVRGAPGTDPGKVGNTSPTFLSEGHREMKGGKQRQR